MMETDKSAFLDVRSYGFRRAAVCVPEGRVGDPAFNVEAHLGILEQAHASGAHYALCPELGISGYSAADLFFQDVLLETSLRGLARLAEATASWNMVISVGIPLSLDGGLYNCAVTIFGGRPVMAAAKAYPPNYREFYELRWFRPAGEAESTQIQLLGHSVPFGSDVILEVKGWDGFALHTDICEDIWVPVPPGTLAALSGATVLGNLSASNITVGKSEYRRELVRGSSAKNLAAQLYGAAGFGESTGDLAWDGHGIIADRGEIVSETERFVIGGTYCLADLDLQALKADRMRQTSWGQNAADWRQPARLVAVEPLTDARPDPIYQRVKRSIEPHPFVPSDPSKLDARCEEIFLIMATSLARRLVSLPEGARHVILGVSGGRDSTLAGLVAARALDLLGLPRTDLIATTMPGFGTTKETYDAAANFSRAIGATFREIPIQDIANAVFDGIGHDPQEEDLTFENVQAWSRKMALFALASREKGIDLGTGDLSEVALGWATYGADHMSHYGMNAGVPKTLVSKLIEWAAAVAFKDEDAVRSALEQVLATPISPELLRPSPSGVLTQVSEDIVGPYELQDFFLYYFTRFGFGPRRIARMALQAFDGKYEIGEIRRWLLVFIRRFFANQFKREAIPDSPKVGSGGSLSPRGDWRMPPDGSPAAWLAEAEAIPES